MSETKDNKAMHHNPFMGQRKTPHGTFDFQNVVIGDYEPAIMEGIRIENEEIDKIVGNDEAPTFENTIEALDKTGDMLSKATTVFFNLLSAETNDEMEELAQKLSPVLTQHSNDIALNKDLFDRVATVYNEYHDDKDKWNELTVEQQTLLDNCYDSFLKSGVNLPEDDKARLREMSEQLSQLTLQFSQNKLDDINDFKLVITDEKELDGLPQSAIEAAAHTAKENDTEGWMFTLHAPSYSPFMTYSSQRQLREKMYMAYNTIGYRDNTHNNAAICRKIVNLRLMIAKLKGYATYSDYVLTKRMAENSNNVYKLLNDLLAAYTDKARVEVEEVEQLAKRTEGDDFKLMPWDFSYYSNKLKEERYNINSEMLRPYLEISKVKEGIFGLATRLYGIKFTINKDIPVYHPDVDAYDVTDEDGKFLGVIYCDFYPRKGKRSGAWMTSYKEQYISDAGENVRPHVSIVMNLTKPTDTKPSLLTLGEVETFIHEFGHSLHGLFANTKYESLSGTNVYWDFVELPSQFMENYVVEKEFLNTFARHYETGEPIPDELLQKVVDSRNFNVAYACLRQVSFGLLDMAYYSRKENLPDDLDIEKFEKEAWKAAQVLPNVDGTCMTTQFSHIMAGGYASGYYSYKWAEVLDADAFSVFKEHGIFDKETGSRFRENILSKGGTEHPMTLYKRFRGQEPTIDALLKRNGLKK